MLHPLPLLALALPTLAAPWNILPRSIDTTFTPPGPYITSGDVTPAPNNLQKRTVGGVRLSNGADFTGNVWYGVVPLADCIALNSYAGILDSFQPDEDTECFLYQGKCDDNADFGDLYNNSTECSNLAAAYPFIAQVDSFMCFTEI